MKALAPARLATRRSQIAAAILECVDSGAAAVRVLPERDRAELGLAALALRGWRAARPVIGEGDRQVFQDFELTTQIPEASAFRALAQVMDTALADAARQIEPNPLPDGFRINDLIMQRYRPGSRGITPHRDHLRYRGLVALLIVSGDGRFCLCADRRGASAREVAALPGDLLLMRAPGLAGSSDRPFHFLDRITVERLSFGLRWDTSVS